MPAGIFDGLTGATAFNNTFSECSALETIPAGLFAKNVNATTVAQCFLNCTRLTMVPSRLFEANTKTKTLTEMFSGCSGIESIAPDAFTGLNGTSLNFQKAFLNCTSLREIPDGLLKTTQISTYTSLFADCSASGRRCSTALRPPCSIRSSTVVRRSKRSARTCWSAPSN